MVFTAFVSRLKPGKLTSPANPIAIQNIAELTHPDFASFAIPLFAFAVKREFEKRWKEKEKTSPPSLWQRRREGQRAQRCWGESFATCSPAAFDLHPQTHCHSQTFSVYLSRPTRRFALFEKHNQAPQKEEQKSTVLYLVIWMSVI